MIQPGFWWRLRYNLSHSIFASWRIWLAMLACTILVYVLKHAAGWNDWVVFGLNLGVSGWLGLLACRADNEQHDEEFEARFADFRKRWEPAMEKTVDTLNARHRDA